MKCEKFFLVFFLIHAVSSEISLKSEPKRTLTREKTVARIIAKLEKSADQEIQTQSAGFAIQGRRWNMEDRFVMRENVNGSGVSIFAIFDGHGNEFVADHCKDEIFENISKKIVEVKKNSENQEIAGNEIDEESSDLRKFLNGTEGNYGKIITSEILEADEKLIQELQKNVMISGSTAVIAVLDGTKLTVANVGDSRGVMCIENGTAIPISFDHKPNDQFEKARIEKAGGFVAFWGVWRVNGTLAVSRAIGDYFLKPNLIIANPDILEFELENYRPKFLMLASDGLFDVFTNQDAADFISKNINEPHFGAKSIAIEAYQRGSTDNISVIVIVFRNGIFQISSN